MTRWDAACQKAHDFEEQCLPYAARERLQVGDVDEHGSILIGGNRLIGCGRIWLPEHQATAAAYYGWKNAGAVIMRSGMLLWLVQR